jgi:hypothetical protein
MIVFVRKKVSTSNRSRPEMVAIHIIESEQELSNTLSKYSEDEEYFVLKGPMDFSVSGDIRPRRVYIKNFGLCTDTQKILISGNWQPLPCSPAKRKSTCLNA